MTRNSTAPNFYRIDPGRTLLAVLVICALTLFVYYPVTDFDFVDLDDDAYVFQNEQVKRGLTLEGIGYAFRTFEMANWNPLTWLSYMADVELFGMSPGTFHRVNAGLHLANALLLLVFLQAATGRLWPSAFVAVLFAVHPLHVESVAWISERKDVLSTFFWMLCNLMYLSYARQGGLARYGGLIALFVLGLAAKPMLVTLPIVLLLMDFWPLRRSTHASIALDAGRTKPAATFFILLEKVPLLFISLAFGVLTLIAQKSFLAVQSLEQLPVATRIANALVSYAGYLGKMVWPRDLTVLYPYADSLPAWLVVFSSVFILGVSSAALLLRKRCPYFLFGWLWYLITLLPVIGIIQVGNQAMADRYTYVPLTGMFIIIAWGGSDLISKWRLPKTGLALLGVILVAVLGVTARTQVSYWRDSITLFSHTLAVTGDNYLAENGLARGYEKQGDLVKAAEHYRNAIGISPGYTAARYNLGNVYVQLGRVNEAIEQYSRVREQDPEDVDTLNNLGKALVVAGRVPEAIEQYQKAHSFSPDNPGILSNLGIALLLDNQPAAAESMFVEALNLDPGFTDAYYNLGYLYEKRAQLNRSGRFYALALQVDPGHKLALKGRRRIESRLRLKSAGGAAGTE